MALTSTINGENYSGMPELSRMQPTLSNYRYSHEEMLAIFSDMPRLSSYQFDNSSNMSSRWPSIFHVDMELPPVSLLPMTDDEQTSLWLCVNSSLAVRNAASAREIWPSHGKESSNQKTNSRKNGSEYGMLSATSWIELNKSVEVDDKEDKDGFIKVKSKRNQRTFSESSINRERLFSSSDKDNSSDYDGSPKRKHIEKGKKGGADRQKNYANQKEKISPSTTPDLLKKFAKIDVRMTSGEGDYCWSRKDVVCENEFSFSLHATASVESAVSKNSCITFCNDFTTSGNVGASSADAESKEKTDSDADSVLVNSFISDESMLGPWFYKDPNGSIQGPFTNEEMLDWFRAGYFTMKLLLRSASVNSFIQLGHLIKSIGRVPFISKSNEPSLADHNMNEMLENVSTDQKKQNFTAAVENNHELEPQKISRQIQIEQYDIIGQHFPPVDSEDISQHAPLVNSYTINQHTLPLNMYDNISQPPLVSSHITSQHPSISSHHTSQHSAPVNSMPLSNGSVAECYMTDAYPLNMPKLYDPSSFNFTDHLLTDDGPKYLSNSTLTKETVDVDAIRRELMEKYERELIERLERELEKGRLELERKVLNEERRLIKEQQRILEEDKERKKEKQQIEEERRLLVEERKKLEEFHKKVERCHAKTEDSLQRERQQEMQNSADKMIRLTEEMRFADEDKEAEIMRKESTLTVERKKIKWIPVNKKKSETENQEQQDAAGSPAPCPWLNNTRVASNSRVEFGKDRGKSDEDDLLKKLNLQRQHLATIKDEKQNETNDWTASSSAVQTTIKSLIEIQKEQEKEEDAERKRKELLLKKSVVWGQIQNPSLVRKPVTLNSKVPSSNTTTCIPSLMSLSPTFIALASKSTLSDEDDLVMWCRMKLGDLKTSVDIPTLIELIKDVESPYELNDYVRLYLGESKETRDFAQQFRERKNQMKQSGRNRSNQKP